MPMNKLAVCLGRVGDILNIIPPCRKVGIEFVMVCREFEHALSGTRISPVTWDGDVEDLAGAYAKAIHMADSVVVPQLFGTHQPPGMPERKRASFVQDQWDRISPDLGDIWGTLPLDIERPFSPFTEMAMRESDKPVLLLNTSGKSSPYHLAGKLRAHLDAAWFDRFAITDISGIRCREIRNLLPLYDRAVGLITTDTATLHLARACPRLPVFQLRRTGRDGTLPMGTMVQSYDVSNFDMLNVFLKEVQ
jgi:hypothetical protein